MITIRDAGRLGGDPSILAADAVAGDDAGVAGVAACAAAAHLQVESVF